MKSRTYLIAWQSIAPLFRNREALLLSPHSPPSEKVEKNEKEKKNKR